jgi:hypothetical protein
MYGDIRRELDANGVVCKGERGGKSLEVTVCVGNVFSGEQNKDEAECWVSTKSSSGSNLSAPAAEWREHSTVSSPQPGSLLFRM